MCLLSVTKLNILLQYDFIGMKFPTTPPPSRKHHTGIQAAVLLPDSYPLTKSKSHESQLAASKNDNTDSNNIK